MAYSIVFSGPENGTKTFTLYRATGQQARTHEASGDQLVTDGPVNFGSEPQVIDAGDYRVSVGLRSDPFFADLNDFQWTGKDTMADMNTFSMAMEVPNGDLGGDSTIGVWARVSVRRDGELVSVDRGAHPSLTAYFNAEDAKEEYNAREQADDWDNYREPWTAVLQHTGKYTVESAEQTLRTVLPDILRYDRSMPAQYPNGRASTDDVTSARLNMVSNGAVPTDNIGPHTDLLPDFPYLGHPHRPPGLAGLPRAAMGRLTL